MRTSLARIFSVLLFFLCCSASAQPLTTEQMEPLKFRHIGPIGNQVIAATGIPGNPMIYYVGAASGGIWKTTDGGLIWQPVFDEQRVHSIGALALAPSDPEVVYAGTGESFIRSNASAVKADSAIGTSWALWSRFTVSR